jgi:hypothetical protein
VSRESGEKQQSQCRAVAWSSPAMESPATAPWEIRCPGLVFGGGVHYESSETFSVRRLLVCVSAAAESDYRCESN